MQSSSQLTNETKQRISQLIGRDDWYDNQLQLIPANIIGLGYKWYPIVIKSDGDSHTEFQKEAKFNIHPCINTFVGHNMDKTVIYDQKDVTKDIVIGLMGRSHPGFYGELSIYQTIIDPKEVTDEINQLNQSPSHLIGFMRAFDLCELQLDTEKYYLHQQNCMSSGSVESKKWEVNIKLKAEKKRVFNWVMTLDLKKKKVSENGTVNRK